MRRAALVKKPFSCPGQFIDFRGFYNPPLDAARLPLCHPTRCRETFEVSPGIHWLRMPLPFALNHINLWLLEDDAGWTIVDTGFALDAVKECWQAILDRLAATKRGGRITRIIVTHFHPDHLGLAAWLQERPARRCG
jgi:hypothetical protein